MDMYGDISSEFIQRNFFEVAGPPYHLEVSLAVAITTLY